MVVLICADVFGEADVLIEIAGDLGEIVGTFDALPACCCSRGVTTGAP